MGLFLMPFYRIDAIVTIACKELRKWFIRFHVESMFSQRLFINVMVFGFLWGIAILSAPPETGPSPKYINTLGTWLTTPLQAFGIIIVKNLLAGVFARVLRWLQNYFDPKGAQSFTKQFRNGDLAWGMVFASVLLFFTAGIFLPVIAWAFGQLIVSICGIGDAYGIFVERDHDQHWRKRKKREGRVADLLELLERISLRPHPAN